MACKRRKVVLLIVEGPSDETALEQTFVSFSNPSNIVSSIGNLVKRCASKYGLKRPDFLRIIHIYLI